MASKDYDQNDNEYKDNAGAAAVERDVEAARRAQEVAERMKAERMRKAAAQDAELQRRADAQERVDDAIRNKKAEQARARAEQETRAEKVREQEILKKQQEARELRQRKKEEQIAEERAKRKQDTASKYQAERDARRAKTEQQREAKNKERQRRPEKVKQTQQSKEDAAQYQEDMNEKFKHSKAGIEKAAFEGAENRRMWQEMEDKKESTRPHGPGSKPSPSVAITNRMFDTLASAGGTVKKHWDASKSDIFKVPFQPRENIGTDKEIKLSRQKNPYASSIFGSVAKPRGATPNGLLSLGSFTGTPSQLFAAKKPRAVRKPRSTSRSAPRSHTRNTLDDMLFF